MVISHWPGAFLPTQEIILSLSLQKKYFHDKMQRRCIGMPLGGVVSKDIEMQGLFPDNVYGVIKSVLLFIGLGV